VRALVAPVVEAAGLDLEDLSLSSAGRRRLLRIAVERDGGVSLDDIAHVSQGISDVLDSSDVMGELAYVLEVGSPGVDRPLTEPRHWRRARGRLVRASLRDGREVTGRVLLVDQAGVTLDVSGKDRRLELVDVAQARVEVEFARRGPDDEAGEGPADATGNDEGEEA
jgi:ribosome maturation factor RimP